MTDPLPSEVTWIWLLTQVRVRGQGGSTKDPIVYCIRCQYMVKFRSWVNVIGLTEWAQRHFAESGCPETPRDVVPSVNASA